MNRQEQVIEEARTQALCMMKCMNDLDPGSEELERQAKIAKMMLDSCINANESICKLEQDDVRMGLETSTQSRQVDNEKKLKLIELGVTSALMVGQIAVGIWAFSFANVFELEDTYSKATSKHVVSKMMDLMRLRK